MTPASGFATRAAAGEQPFDRPHHAAAAGVAALVVEQRAEVVLLERVEQADDLVWIEVVVVLDRRSAVRGGAGLAFALLAGP